MSLSSTIFGLNATIESSRTSSNSALCENIMLDVTSWCFKSNFFFFFGEIMVPYNSCFELESFSLVLYDHLNF